ncbi:COG4315 family predicted lipoprotein [Arthrobacter pascens]|uniref:COG4315 family predicted lipoprotein n=1 Tax=Arthrobacter pascens TaxID=1677 RepID=UPI003593D8CC
MPRSPVTTREAFPYTASTPTANSSTTTRVGDCAVKWPPLLVGAAAKIYTENVDASLIGYVERADGTCQVTIGGWQVYYFAGDKAPGESRGKELAAPGSPSTEQARKQPNWPHLPAPRRTDKRFWFSVCGGRCQGVRV